MSANYDQMWSDLGLNLEAHEALLQVLGEGYTNIFLSQTDRPAGMDYFNFVMSEVHGLRVKELVDGQKEGKKVIGSFCVFVPEEDCARCRCHACGALHRSGFCHGRSGKDTPEEHVLADQVRVRLQTWQGLSLYRIGRHDRGRKYL